jgi:hypothetical protein
MTPVLLSRELILTQGENHMLKKFLQDETGAELAEYAVGVALLVGDWHRRLQGAWQCINTSNESTGSNIKNAKFP